MKYQDIQYVEEAAWSAFFNVYRSEGATDEQIKKLSVALSHKDCYNEVMDVLVEVLCNG